MRWLIAVLFFLLSVQAQAALYYISPTGNDSTGVGSSASPWKTWTKVNSVMGCGDSAVLKNGTYGDGTTTGKIAVSGRACTLASPLTITVENQRQAMINDNGCGIAVDVLNSSGVVIDGLYVTSNDNNTTGCFDAGDGTPLRVKSSSSVILRNNVSHNPNRYANSHAIDLLFVQNVTLEDNELYVFHRHGVDAWQSSNVVSRRTYCNPRGGKISGGFGLDQGPIGSGAACLSMYPCTDCIEENAIADGTTSPMYLAEMNSSFGSGVLMSGSKVLGSICYKCNYGNGVYPNARTIADLNHTPQNITIRDVAIVDYDGTANGIRCSDCVNTTIDHVTILSLGSGTNGIVGDNTSVGATSAQSSLTITNTVVAGFTAGAGLRISGYDTWSGDEIYSTGNGTNFSPSLPSNWTNTSTADHGMGTCKAWIPAASPLKGAGTGSSDIGATILYRYVNGVLTSTPLWDPVTGTFPHGAFTADGVNNVAGDSLFDFHTRVNINMNGCPFPSGYGATAPTNPANVVATTDTEGAHIHVIPIGTKALTVMVTARHDGLNVAAPDGVAVSCGSWNMAPITTLGITPANDRSARTFGWLNPTPGTCTLTPSFTDPSRVSGWVMVSIDDATTTSYGTTASTSAQSATPSGSVSVTGTETLLVFLGTSNAPALAAGPFQILLTDKQHATKALRGALSTQSGTDGGLAGYTLGSSVGWIQQIVSLISSGGGGSGSTFRLSKYRIYGLLGPTSDPEVSLGALGEQDTSAHVGIGGAARIRSEIIVETAASVTTGTSLYCKKNAGSFARVTNTFGGNDIRLYGPGLEANMPVNGLATTQRFTGTFLPGIVVRDDNSPATLGATPSDTRREIDHLVVLGNAAAQDDVFSCEIRRDDGSTLGVHTVTPTIIADRPSASMGF